MNIESYFRENVLSVSQVTGYVKELIEGVPVFSGMSVRGEISNFVNHRSGHLYFSLKDEGAVLRGIMFARDAKGLDFKIGDGMKVVANGRLTVYAASGQYQMVVSEMRPDGKGALYEAYERLKQKLEAEGLFSDRYKREIPRFPKRIGVITSPTGAAVRDMINVTRRRWPAAEIVLYPALVQGDGAVASLISGIEYFRQNPPDTVIIGRGGGSIEDLWAFNSEELARTIAFSGLPVISAVGHETDFTICDFVSSVRAPTPSAAAEIAVPDRDAVLREFTGFENRLKLLTDNKLRALKDRLARIESKRVVSSPYGFIDEKRIMLASISDKLEKRNALKLAAAKGDFAALAGKLNALSPLAVLTRGYSAVYGDTGEVLTSVSSVKEGDAVRVVMKDGEIRAQAKEIVSKVR
ncbi:MAG: exodeoxyribonuclease VII large subunit [Ruminococcaceae bacterium]|nr:exodeoxyribonuclease VII large subunit [Oscillospiraceae bacterium]